MTKSKEIQPVELSPETQEYLDWQIERSERARKKLQRKSYLKAFGELVANVLGSIIGLIAFAIYFIAGIGGCLIRIVLFFLAFYLGWWFLVIVFTLITGGF